MAVQAHERPEAETVGSSPARRLSTARREGLKQHFQPTDPRIDLLRLPVVGPWLDRAVKSRPFQFTMILPNQIIFWVVIVTGLVGAALPQRNFATVITWYLWFCVVFVLMVGAGRAWCQMCPFGGAAEWVQRLSFWQRHPVSIGLHWKWPESWSRYGLLPSVGVFLLMTWAEEFLNIAGPGRPLFTGLMVLFIISFAVGTFLVFDRRTFCRYLCPLTAVIGTIGATGMVAGLRTRDRELCLSCATKDCMRGSAHGYGCPWYEWPGSSTSNLMCGLCTECVKSCPHDNIGLFVQAPLTSVVAPTRRRLDVAVAVLVLFGLVVFQQINALAFYGPIDTAVNNLIHFPSYPDPIIYVTVIAALAGLVAFYVWALRAGLGGRDRTAAKASNLGFTAWLTPIAYGMIPLMAGDFLARQLPKMWLNLPKLIASISDPFGYGWNLFGTAHLAIANVQILSIQGVIVTQVAVVALGTLGAAYATVRIARRDLRKLTDHPRAVVAVSTAAVVLGGVAVSILYVAMGAAA